MTSVEAPVSHLRENPFELAREQLRRVATTFDIDPNLVRIAFVLLTLVTGIFPTVIAYIVAWALVPMNGRASETTIGVSATHTSEHRGAA